MVTPAATTTAATATAAATTTEAAAAATAAAATAQEAEAAATQVSPVTEQAVVTRDHQNTRQGTCSGWRLVTAAAIFWHG